MFQIQNKKIYQIQLIYFIISILLSSMCYIVIFNVFHPVELKRIPNDKIIILDNLHYKSDYVYNTSLGNICLFKNPIEIDIQYYSNKRLCVDYYVRHMLCLLLFVFTLCTSIMFSLSYILISELEVLEDIESKIPRSILKKKKYFWPSIIGNLDQKSTTYLEFYLFCSKLYSYKIN